jgi:hypothetical protein
MIDRVGESDAVEALRMDPRGDVVDGLLVEPLGRVGLEMTGPVDAPELDARVGRVEDPPAGSVKRERLAKSECQAGEDGEYEAHPLAEEPGGDDVTPGFYCMYSNGICCITYWTRECTAAGPGTRQVASRTGAGPPGTVRWSKKCRVRADRCATVYIYTCAPPVQYSYISGRAILETWDERLSQHAQITCIPSPVPRQAQHKAVPFRIPSSWTNMRLTCEIPTGWSWSFPGSETITWTRCITFPLTLSCRFVSIVSHWTIGFVISSVTK